MDFKQLISHSKEYGFIFQSSEIYDGLSAVYDYGPMGVELKNNIKKYWDIFGKYEKNSVTNKIYYDESKGKIIVTFNIKAGKAKEPLKKICQNVFKSEIDRSWYIPNQKITAASPNSRLLKQLYRGGSYKDYNKQIEKVANNIVYTLSVNSEVLKSIDNQAKDFFNMTCYKLKPNDEIIYRKWSFEMK